MRALSVNEFKQRDFTRLLLPGGRRRRPGIAMETPGRGKGYGKSKIYFLRGKSGQNRNLPS
jgi:hypothetical protein